MSLHKKSIVAAGHTLTSQTAATILREGGNAFDAIVAAGFAAAVVEPTLTSLGGGGLLLGHNARDGRDFFFDFFVDTPGRGLDANSLEPHFFPVTVKFSGSDQIFNVGLGSAAVPGQLKGLIHTQKRLGSMSLKDVISPAARLARHHMINQQQGSFLQLLYPIMTLTEAGRDLYEPGGNYLQPRDPMVNENMADFLEQVIDDEGDSFYRGELAAGIEEDMREGHGLLTRADLEAYEVRELKPLRLKYRGMDFYTSPPPSMGGVLIGLSLSLLSQEGKPDFEWGTPTHLLNTVGLMQEVEKIRKQGVTTPETFKNFLDDVDRCWYSVETIRLFSRGTTHISVADRDGNCASMTSSNGEGSGYFAPGTGVMLNNMMGEDDLHPDGFHSSPPGERVSSMMSPSMLVKDGQVQLVIGSGGSKRIRPAISQTLSQVVDFGKSLQEAVDAPRLYWDGDCVQIEPGFDDQSLAALEKHLRINVWDDIDVYFGGVHAVIPGKEGAGDKRRGGAVEEVPGP